MARIKSTNFYQKSGKVANEVFSNLGNGVVGCRAQNSKQAPLNAEQKINASGFSALNAEVRYLNPVLRVTFPRDTNGTKWANRFTSVNKKREGVLTTTKINPDTPVDPKKKANEEYTSEIDWTKVLFAAGPLLVPSVTVSKTTEAGETYSVVFTQEANVLRGCLLLDERSPLRCPLQPRRSFRPCQATTRPGRERRDLHLRPFFRQAGEHPRLQSRHDRRRENHLQLRSHHVGSVRSTWRLTAARAAVNFRLQILNFHPPDQRFLISCFYLNSALSSNSGKFFVTSRK